MAIDGHTGKGRDRIKIYIVKSYKGQKVVDCLDRLIRSGHGTLKKMLYLFFKVIMHLAIEQCLLILYIKDHVLRSVFKNGYGQMRPVSLSKDHTSSNLGDCHYRIAKRLEMTDVWFYWRMPWTRHVSNKDVPRKTRTTKKRIITVRKQLKFQGHTRKGDVEKLILRGHI